MAIIDLSVTEGSEIKTSEESTEKYVASRVLVEPAQGFYITQRDAVSAFVGGILMAIIRN